MAKPLPGESGSAPVVVSMPAEIDLANAAAVRADLLAAFDSGARVVVADLTSTDYCDSTGFRTLAAAHRAGVAARRQLRLAVAPAGVVARTLSLLELDKLLAVYPGISEARSAPG
jgi:anti-sigma B factor antagonist